MDKHTAISTFKHCLALRCRNHKEITESKDHFDGLVQDYSNFVANVLEILLSYPKSLSLLHTFSTKGVANLGPLLLTRFNFNPSMDK